MSLEFAVVSRRDFVKINGECHWLWRLVNQEGEVLKSYDTKRQNRKLALAQQVGGQFTPAVLTRSARHIAFSAREKLWNIGRIKGNILTQ